MSTRIMDDFNSHALTVEQLDQRIRQGNLRMAWRIRWEFSPADWARLETLCRQEWGALWREEVAK